VTCREATEFLSAYLDDELPPDIRQMFEQHLEACPNCVTFLDQFRLTVEAEIGGPDRSDADATTAMPEELVRGITAAVRQKP
jgi:anti-sigma factor RsiW